MKSIFAPRKSLRILAASLLCCMLTPLALADGRQAADSPPGIDGIAQSVHVPDQAVEFVNEAQGPVAPGVEAMNTPTSTGGEDFESGASGWAMDPLWHLTDRVPGGGGTTSSNHWAWYGQGSASAVDYNTGSTNAGNLQSSSFTVPGGAMLSFNSWYSTENTASYPSADAKLVQLSVNGGAAQTVAKIQGYDQTAPNYSPAGTVTAVTVSLGSHAGETVRLIFRFDTWDPIDNNHEGWYVDNVKVTGTTSNTSPVACFTVNPTTGTTSTTFNVDASCSTDAETNAANLQVRWDWQNDGTFDTAFSSTKSASHTYASSGTYTIRMQVQDASSPPGTSSATRTVTVNPAASPPTACFTVNPTSGSVSTVFAVDAGCSSDLQDGAGALSVRWDWDNDGAYDTAPATTKTATHTYATTGTKTIKLEVTDTSADKGTTTRMVAVNGKPSAPQNVAIGCKSSGDGLRLSWTAPSSDGGAPITQYQVLRGTTSNPTIVVGTPSTTSFDDLPPWTTTSYYYRVKAVNLNGDASDASNDVALPPCDKTVPSAVGTMSSSTHGDTSRYYNRVTVTVSWGTATDSYSGINGYVTLLSQDPNAVPVCTGPDAAWVSGTSDSGVVSGSNLFATYHFLVRARDNAGNCGAKKDFVVHIDTDQPDISMKTEGVTANPFQTVNVRYDDQDGGLDTGSSTLVDVAAVRLYVDGADRTNEASVDANGLSYTPDLAWSTGVHSLELWLKDTSVASDYAVTDWSIEFRASSVLGDDSGGGGNGLCGEDLQVVAANLGGTCRDGKYANPLLDTPLGIVTNSGPIKNAGLN